MIGGGRMARAIARILSAVGSPVRIFARSARQRADLARDLEGSGASVATSIKDAVEGAQIVFMAVPAPAIEAVAEQYGEHAQGDQVVLHASRGVGAGFVLPHQMIRNKSCVRKIAVLGGPLHAPELASGRPLAAVVASRFAEACHMVQAIAKGTPVVIHESRDVVGVEVAGALSNVSQIGAGMAEALELGETARGVLLTRGLAEAKRLGLALGAEAQTFAGLAGVGDLIPRKVSSTDRHRMLGGLVAKGKTLAAAFELVGGNESTDAGVHTIEGVLTAREAAALSERLGLDLPMMCTIDAILRGERSPKDALESILRLDLDLDARVQRSHDA